MKWWMRIFHIFLVMSLPASAVTAYLMGSETVLLAMALTLPCLLILQAVKFKGQRQPQQVGAKNLSHKEFVALLDDCLENASDFRRSACIVISIDDFENFSKTLDGKACDQAVQMTFERLVSTLRGGDAVCRLSRSEFAVLLRSIRAPETSAVLTFCERLDTATSAQMQIDGQASHLTISTGFCLDNRAQERTGEALLAGARAALKEAEQNAPRAIRGFSNKTAAPVLTPLSTEVLDALRDGQISTWYQPQISTDTGDITGFEALARWEHPQKGVLPPTAFIPALEAANRLEELGEKILNDALRSLVEWDKTGALVPSVAVNFATTELRNPSLVERIKWDVDRFELDPSRLTVEVLETVISEHEDDIITRNIRALGAQGFRIDLDDFGTGHASLSNIRRFAVDRIKIDRSFVASVDSDPEQQRMVAAIIGLGERLGLETLAEGVENIGEQSILSQLGCNHLQGYAIARPMSFDKTLDWIEQHQKSLSRPHMLSRRPR